MNLFDIGHIAFTVLGYPVSYVELIGTLFGLLSVYFASRANILTWATGIVNEVFFFVLFFQVYLYADMFLQVYFFAVTLYGWYNWKVNASGKSISTLGLKGKGFLVVSILVFSLMAGYFFSNIHLYLPAFFAVPASYPYIDSFIMVSSIVASVLLAKKKTDTWYVWIVVDVVCVWLYYKKGVYFLSLEYLLFLGLAVSGLYHWLKESKDG